MSKAIVRSREFLFLPVVLIGFIFFFSCTDKGTDDGGAHDPAVKIAYPTDGATLNRYDSIIVTYPQNLPITRAEFILDDEIIFSNGNPPYDYKDWYTWSYADTVSHQLWVKIHGSSSVTGIDYTVSSPAVTVFVDKTAPAAISDLSVIDSSLNSVTLQWTAPGDNGVIGIASEYDIRYSTSHFHSYNWYLATPVEGEPAPDSAGHMQTFTVAGLGPDTLYFFRVKSVDKAGLESDISNEVSAITNGLPAITDLQIVDSSVYSITLSWTVPVSNDPFSGYDVRYSYSPITESNWDDAYQVENEPLPGTAGSQEIFEIDGLPHQSLGNMEYYFGVRIYDDASHLSPLSNIVYGRMMPYFVTHENLATGQQSKAVCAADFDNDLDIDLASASYVNGDIAISFNDGSGSFQIEHNYSVGTNPCAIASQDFNGDNFQDLAVANSGSDNITILLNDGNGAFPGDSNYSAGNLPCGLYCEDIDNDMDYDILVGYSDSNYISILRNNGDGTFVPPFDISVGSHPVSIVSGDFDGDGDADLATADNQSNTVTILRNAGLGTFEFFGQYSVLSGPEHILSADFEKDGDLDLVITLRNTQYVAILRNNADGTFAGPHNISGGNPTAAAVADFNNDSYSDLVVFPQYGEILLFLNDGSGFFSGILPLPGGGFFETCVAADFDGDSDLDIALGPGSESANGIQVKMNMFIQ